MQLQYYFCKNIFSKKEIKQINKLAKNKSTTGIKDGPANERVKTAKVSIIEWQFIKHILYKLEQISSFTNQQYFGFNIQPMNDFNGIFHNEYNSNNLGQYEYHYDDNPNSISTTLKLTCLVNTSEKNYEGGKFFLHLGKETHIQELDEPGSILIFPSIFLHKVEPVTKGIRSTVVMWRVGNHWF
jgi:predicted 2-oxoglutarate/Fe(II)-dependent dioxygenase YbiX